MMVYAWLCRLNALAEGFHKVTSEVQDAIDGMLCELTHLNNQIDNAEPIGSTVNKIMDQIQENKVNISYYNTFQSTG